MKIVSLRKKTVGTGAFTLLELLVVIGLIAVLASMTVVLSRSFNLKSQETRCISNLRQTGVAVLAYAADRNQMLRFQIGGSNLEYGWTRLVVNTGYLSRITPWDTLYCPSAKISDKAKTAMQNYTPASPNKGAGDVWRWWTYGMNMCRITGKLTTVTDPETNLTFFALPILKIDQPSLHVLLADSSSGPDEHLQCQAMERDNKRGLGLRHGAPGDRHANAIFLDGHVGQINRARATELATAKFAYGLNLPAQFVFDVDN